MSRRPTSAAAPSALTSVAASSGETPSPRAIGTRCTSGTNTGIQVALNTAKSIQNARVRIARPGRPCLRARGAARSGPRVAVGAEAERLGIAPHEDGERVEGEDDRDAEDDVGPAPAEPAHHDVGDRRQREGAEAAARAGQARSRGRGGA